MIKLTIENIPKKKLVLNQLLFNEIAFFNAYNYINHNCVFINDVKSMFLCYIGEYLQ
jgi:hypothetical protein